MNPDIKLSDDELYLLCLGIYLHDTGMQCDIKKYPELINALQRHFPDIPWEQLFDCNSAEYSAKEQQDIRKYHNYLSYAYVEFSYLKETNLSPEIKKIEENILFDVLDACKFHSNLSLHDCNKEFQFKPQARKRLILCLIRLADEMDIGNQRICFDTVQNFGIEPKNALFWWIHNYTTIEFKPSSTNAIYIQITLHPNDFLIYDRKVQELFINTFKSKNQPIIDLLVDHNIIFVVSNESGVKENPYQPKLPDDICEHIDSINNDKKVIIGEPDYQDEDDEGIMDFQDAAINSLESITCIINTMTETTKKLATEFSESKQEFLKLEQKRYDDRKGKKAHFKRVGDVIIEFASVMEEENDKFDLEWTKFYGKSDKLFTSELIIDNTTKIEAEYLKNKKCFNKTCGLISMTPPA